MWRFASLLLTPLVVAGVEISPHVEQRNNNTSTINSVTLKSSTPGALVASSPVIVVSNILGTKSSSISSSSSASKSPVSILGTSSGAFKSSSRSLSSSLISQSFTVTTQNPQSTGPVLPSIDPSKSLKGNDSSNVRPTSSYASKNATTSGSCTGCVIEAYHPITTSFGDNLSNGWTSTVVTATIVTSFITYNDTVVTKSATVNMIRTVTDGDDQLITHTTPVFTVQPAPGTFLTLDAGPTYVIYNELYGALDRSISSQWAFPSTTVTMDTCGAEPKLLKNWEPARTEDWTYFITSYKNDAPKTTATNIPYALPSGLLQYLKQNLAILSQYHGSNIETCTLFPTNGLAAPMPTKSKVPGRPLPEFPQPPETEPALTKTQAPVPSSSVSTKTFLETTYESTSTHVTIAGCLRCQNTQLSPEPTPNGPDFSEKGHNAQPEPTPSQSNPLETPTDPNNNQSGPKPGDGNSNNGKSGDQPPPGNPVVIGDSTYTVRPGQPTPVPDRPSDQNQPPPIVVIGSQTLTQGQSTIINGVPVVVPPNVGGSRVVVGGTTYAVNNGPTAVPVLTVGQGTITANSQGQFVVGSETLKPGGPALTIDGSTLSLGSAGTIAIINGVTQTLANVPVITAPPAITVGGHVVAATVIGGTTQLVLGGQTLVAGGSPITISGTTFSLPASGGNTQIVVNGVTSTFSPNQILGGQPLSATIKDGTTAFVLGPDQTLTPGGILTISGTTYSMPASASGSIIVVNGITSTLSPSYPQITAAPALTINGKTYAATTRDGTTEYVLGQGTTLRPGQVVTLSGLTYSLDPKGTALVINGQTSSIARGPASASAKTTSTTSGRGVGDFVWSGIGGGGGGEGASSTSRAGSGSASVHTWVEGLIMGVAGWLLVVL